MPRQNRVTPFGEIVAFPERGTCLGNRGILHDENGRIERVWKVKRWLVCVLEFRGRKRQVMTPHRYTELFFLDEATAFAAGHRPCAECRHASFMTYCEAWKKAVGADKDSPRPRADDMDERLHGERIRRDRSKVVYTAKLGDLPDGAFVSLEADGKQACLLWDGQLLAWSPGGYQEKCKVRNGERVRVLTPKSTIAVMAAGYVPMVHPSAQR